MMLDAFGQPDKAYSRDFLELGRVRVLLKADGKPVNAEIPNSMSVIQMRACMMQGKILIDTPITETALMIKLGELIPNLQSRTAPKQTASTTTSAAAGGKKKKKGKR
jgi:hypothetical protein